MLKQVQQLYENGQKPSREDLSRILATWLGELIIENEKELTDINGYSAGCGSKELWDKYSHVIVRTKGIWETPERIVAISHKDEWFKINTTERSMPLLTEKEMKQDIILINRR